MPVPVRDRLRAVTQDLGSQARVARVLGVSPSRVSRWLKTEDPDAHNRRKLEGLEFVLARLLDVFEPETAAKWLEGFNPFLGNARPIDLLSEGQVADVVAAIQAEESLGYA